MVVDKGVVIHVVQVVAGQDQDVGGPGGLDLHLLLPHGVGRPLVPAIALGGLLGGQDLDPAVGEDVDVDVVEVHFRAEVEHGVAVARHRVDALVLDQPHEMEGGAVFPAVVNRPPQDLVFVKRPVLDGIVDPHQHLGHDPARADVQVAHFAVALVAVGQADVEAVGLEGGVGVRGKEFVHVRRLRGGDGVSFVGRGRAPAVQDDQANRFF